MKSRILALGGLTALLGVTTFGVFAQTGGAQPPTTPPTAGKRQHPRQKREKHPELNRALKALERAKADLQKAARDFGGHRAKAEEHTEEAIKEVQEAIKFDKQ